MTPRPVRRRVAPPPPLVGHDLPPGLPSGDDVITLDPSTDPASLFRRRARRALARRLRQAPGMTDAAMAEIAHTFLRAVSQAEALIKVGTKTAGNGETKPAAGALARADAEARVESPGRP